MAMSSHVLSSSAQRPKRPSPWQRDSNPTVGIVEQDSRSEYSNSCTVSRVKEKLTPHTHVRTKRQLLAQNDSPVMGWYKLGQLEKKDLGYKQPLI